MSEATTTTKKKPIIDVFLGGAKRGFYIGVETVLPSMILGYVIMQFLTLTGLMDVLAIVCAPIMRLFGLPGEAAAVLFSAFFSKAAGAAAACCTVHDFDHPLHADGHSGGPLLQNRSGLRC